GVVKRASGTHFSEVIAARCRAPGLQILKNWLNYHVPWVGRSSLAACMKRPQAAWRKRRSNIQITLDMSLKYLPPLVVSLNWFAAEGALADTQPAGKLIELHSCEVYAGGCTVSSEAPQGGRYMLQVWDLTSGSWQGVKLSGLKVAVLETSSENLADAG